MNHEEMLSQFEETAAYYKSLNESGNQEVIVSFLRDTQDIFGYIPKETIEKIAGIMEIKPVVLDVLLKRYPTLKPEAYKNKITVCTGPRCMANGAGDLMKSLERKLSVKEGGVSKDGKYKLVTQNCMHQCKNGPNVKIDDEIYNKGQALQIEEHLPS